MFDAHISRPTAGVARAADPFRHALALVLAEARTDARTPGEVR